MSVRHESVKLLPFNVFSDQVDAGHGTEHCGMEVHYSQFHFFHGVETFNPSLEQNID